MAMSASSTSSRTWFCNWRTRTSDCRTCSSSRARSASAAGPAIASLSTANHITGSAAWVAALVMMALADVLTRLVIIYLRGRRLAGGATLVSASIPAGVSG